MEKMTVLQKLLKFAVKHSGKIKTYAIGLLLIAVVTVIIWSITNQNRYLAFFGILLTLVGTILVYLFSYIIKNVKNEPIRNVSIPAQVILWTVVLFFVMQVLGTGVAMLSLMFACKPEPLRIMLGLNCNQPTSYSVPTPIPTKTLESYENFDYWTYENEVPEQTARVYRQTFDNLKECQDYQKKENPKYSIDLDRCEDETPDYERLKQMCESGVNLACKMKEFLETGTNQIKNEPKIPEQNEQKPKTIIKEVEVPIQTKSVERNEPIKPKDKVVSSKNEANPNATPTDCSATTNGC